MSGEFPFATPPDVLTIRTFGVTFYALRDGNRLYLIDTGFLGGIAALRHALRARGWDQLPIAGILLTHGHLDHAFNVAQLVRETGAWVAAHRLERAQIAGRYVHHGVGRVCGALEAAGRALFRYQPHEPERWLEDGDELPIGSGLRVIHLPGHTEGHVGFHDPNRGLLFTADLFASFPLVPHRPPNILNSHPALIPGSIARALSLQPRGILPNHGDAASPLRHLERLRKLAARHID